MDDYKELNGPSVESGVPSITGFEQKRVDGKSKKVLQRTLEKSNFLKKNLSGVPKIDVCCRINSRQHISHQSCIPTGDNTLSILNDNTVALRNTSAHDDVTKYTFSTVFGPYVDQKKFFNYFVYDKVLRFLNGSNEFFFAYGTTNVGKTYTIYGNQNEPGIIPRSLALVFNILNDSITSKCNLKPCKVSEAYILDTFWMEKEEEKRDYILSNWCDEKIQNDFKSHTHPTDGGQTLHSIKNLTCSTITKMFDSLKDDKIPSLKHGDVFYSIWVTYTEINNETVYDLLTSYSVNQKRSALKLLFDKNKNAYVKGLTHIFVQSAAEAYKVMSFGQNNLKIARNNLNSLFSRSHSIFTLKLMRIKNINYPEKMTMSRISFCDMAGSERLQKTLNIDDQPTESEHINSSLWVLNKCLSTLRDNQKCGENRLVPFGESKLTQMFQTALTGNNINSGISMVVNVNGSLNLREETKQVLFISAIDCLVNKSKSTAAPKPSPSFAVCGNNQKNLPKFNQIEDKKNLDNSNDENNCKNKFQEVNANDHPLLSKMQVNDLNILKPHEHFEDLENDSRIFKSTFEELQTAFIKPKTNSVSVSTDLCDINLLSKLKCRPKRKHKTTATLQTLDKNTRNTKKNIKDDSDLFDKLIEETIDKIPTSTKKRKLFNKTTFIHKLPFNDSNLTESSNHVPPLLILQHLKKRVKKSC